MHDVIAYDVYHNTHKWTVASVEKAREYATRITTEGLWYREGEEEIFLPVHSVLKVKIRPVEVTPVPNITK